MAKMIYSENNERMIHSGFTTEKAWHFTWNEADEMYYNDADEDLPGIELDTLDLLVADDLFIGQWD